MSSLLQALEALPAAKISLVSGVIGGLLGGLFSLAGSWLMWLLQRRAEKARWRREDATRFHAERRIAYAGFIAVATALSDSILLRAEVPEESAREEGRLFAEISLIATASVHEDAAAAHVVLALLCASPMNYKGDNARAQTFADLMATFRESCRRELGVEKARG